MKWIVVALALANAGYFSWQYSQYRPASAVRAPTVPERAGHVNRLLLLAEVDPGELRERVLTPVPPPEPVVGIELTPDPEIPEPAAAQAADAGPGRLCYSVGPLTTEAEIELMKVWLEEQGGEPALRIDERRELARYWVYFPPLPSREAAVQRVENMKREGIEDIYIIPRGDMGNAISLGVYSRKVSLERRLEQLRSKGYEPSIAPRYRTTKASWFDVDFDPDFRFPADSFADAFPTAEMSPVACNAQQIARDPRSPYNAPEQKRAYQYSGVGSADEEAPPGAASPPEPRAAEADAGATGTGIDTATGTGPGTGTDPDTAAAPAEARLPDGAFVLPTFQPAPVAPLPAGGESAEPAGSGQPGVQ